MHAHAYILSRTYIFNACVNASMQAFIHSIMHACMHTQKHTLANAHTSAHTPHKHKHTHSLTHSLTQVAMVAMLENGDTFSVSLDNFCALGCLQNKMAVDRARSRRILMASILQSPQNSDLV